MSRRTDDPLKPVLPADLAVQIEAACARADELYASGDYVTAASQYIAAWRLLPRPREQWEAGCGIIKCWGEAYLTAGQPDVAINSFESARVYPGGDRDAPLFVLLATAYLCAGDRPRARRAFELGGEAAFDDASPDVRALLGPTR